MPVGVNGPMQGLSEAEAEAGLKQDGPNQLPHAGTRSIFNILVSVVREPMYALLLGAGVVYVALGDPGEAALVFAFALVSVTITIVQEGRSERVLEALRDLASPRALVIREGNRKRIAGRDVVRGDLIVLAEGDRVPADAVLRASHDLHADESLLTGESVPVRKTQAQGPPLVARPGGDDLPLVFSGTLVVRGQGIGEVYATGALSEIGKIGHSIGAIADEPPPLRAEIGRLVRRLGIAGLALSAAVATLSIIMRGAWRDRILGGIALGMSLLPEEFPLVLTVFMVMGAWRISRARVLTRRAAAIETLGAATVLCTDKTGTLTENRMTVAELWDGAESLRPQDEPADELPPRFRTLLELAVLASAPDASDPIDGAVHEVARNRLPAAQHRHTAPVLVHSYGLRPELLAVTQVWKVAESTACVAAAKGAPETIAALCHLDAAALAALRDAADAMAARGRRILAVAGASVAGPPWPESQRDFAFRFEGLVGFADPLRATVPDAVRECRAAGIRVAVITGDYAATARAIANEAGIEARGSLTGEEIDRLGDAALSEHVKNVSVFARVLPEQKLRLVRAFKANGEIVAMTGDGVNDAPSLKAAHIGIAMGGRGTDVAREAAAIVLLDDDFGSIVHTIRLGRRIYDNLRKAMGYILAVHVPIAGLAILPLAFGWPLILTPVHIAFIEMLIDPVCSIVFEAEDEEADVMRRAPRDPRSPLFSGRLIAWSLAQGTAVLLLLSAIVVIGLHRHMPEPELRALAFVALVVTNLGVIFVNRSFSASIVTALRRKNAALWWVMATTATFLGIVLFWPPARKLFRFGPLHADDLALCAAAGIGVLVGLDGLKSLWRSRLAPEHHASQAM